MRRRPGGGVRPLASADPGSSSALSPSIPWPRSAVRKASGGCNRGRAIHARGAKREGLPFRFLPALLIAPCLLTGCAATHVAIAKRNLEVSTRTSDAVFLDGSGDKRTAFIYVRNTSDRPDFDIETPFKSAIPGRGYRIVSDPEVARFKLQVQVPSDSRMSITAAEAALGAGGGVAGATTTSSGQGTAIGAVAGGIAETIANAVDRQGWLCTWAAVPGVDPGATPASCRRRSRRGSRSRKLAIATVRADGGRPHDGSR